MRISERCVERDVVDGGREGAKGGVACIQAKS